jgi:hypothetical protein
MIECMQLPSPWLATSSYWPSKGCGISIDNIVHCSNFVTLPAQYAKLHHSIDLLIDRSCGLRPSMDRIRKAIPPSQTHPRSLLGIYLAALDGPASLARRHGRCPAATPSKIRSTRPHCPGRDRMRCSRGHKQDLSDVEAFGEAAWLLQRLAEQIFLEVSGQF